MRKEERIIYCLNRDYGEGNDNVKLVEAALEKQIPRAPHYEGDGYDDSGNLIYDTWICPNCEDRYELDYEVHQYCPVCGQRIDWGDPSQKGGACYE